MQRRYAERDPTLGPAIAIAAVPFGPNDAQVSIIAEAADPVVVGDGYRVYIRWNVTTRKPVAEASGPRASSEEAKEAMLRALGTALYGPPTPWPEEFRKMLEDPETLRRLDKEVESETQ